MKKFIILLLSIFLAMSLAACGNKTDSRVHQERQRSKMPKSFLHSLEQLRRRREIRHRRRRYDGRKYDRGCAGDIWDHGCG